MNQGLSKIISVATGKDFSLFLDINGTVWSCGFNEVGQLGLGLDNGSHINKPEKITSLPKIKAIFCTGWSSFFIDVEGSNWCCGSNQFGQLGLGDLQHRNVPTKLNGGPLAAISGFSHTLFLDSSGSVWSCGLNEDGQLGSGTVNSRCKPEKINGLPKICAVSGGINFSMFLDYTGSVWACGSNKFGELGLGHTSATTKPGKVHNLPVITSIGAAYFCSILLDKSGNIFTWKK